MAARAYQIFKNVVGKIVEFQQFEVGYLLSMNKNIRESLLPYVACFRTKSFQKIQIQLFKTDGSMGYN
ncbi:MAG: hypothetical protein FWC41_12625 [Firmicutes bacterium]|nr:hypothetical protein [Bacillota bacterium]